ncbi:FK506-binding protein 15 isoform X2 [Eucyclogobius newberryi]|uniref:FK506-binding protein 15 isoform X2 n=1 Tax=Eucyclogobius newberryi TaxID=166745 RepID=UPI003B59F6A8
MFAGDDEDGDFLSPAGGAKLASLFGLDQETSRGNESFQYTAPKQPRKNSNPALPSQKAASTPGAPAVLFATAVQAFRYINGQYVNQGKLGAAILGTHPTREYKLLLYLSQQKQVTAAKIHAGFVFTVQPNNYCTFYDDQRQNWSLMFESDKASSDFCKEACLAKANTAPSLDCVVSQDLCLGEGQGVDTGDSLEVVYTGWLLQNHIVGQMFDTNQNKDKLLRLKLGAGKVIKGWEEGMQGMSKSGRRLIIVPPNLAYGSKGVPNRVPPNSTLIFEAEIRRVKFSKDNGSDRGSSKDSAAPSPAPSPAPSVESLPPEPITQPHPTPTGPGRPTEPPLRTKSNSLSEQLAHPDATKAKLISRMAKMGQPMLPFITGVSSQPESSDSELEDTSGTRLKDRPAVPSPVQMTTASSGSGLHTVHPQPHSVPAPSALLPVSSVPSHSHPGTVHAFQPYPYTQSSTAASQLQPVGPVYPPQTTSYMGSSDVTSFLMTEARQHNTEIRFAVSKVGDKVEQLATKIDELQRQGNPMMAVPSMSMETSMIMQSIQRIVQENECLKKEVFDKSSRIEEQNHKIGELINQNQRYMEQSHLLLEQRTDTLKSTSEHNTQRLLQAEQEKVRLTEDLAASTARLAQLQLEASAHQQRAMELQSKLNAALQEGENHGQQVATLRSQLDELKEEAERHQAQYRSEKQKRKELELRVNNVEEELQDLKTDKDALERTLSERKKKWQDERQRRDEELEELRRSSRQDLDNLRAQLRKARSSSDNAVSEQLSQLQAELEEEWRGKCDQAVTAARRQHIREMSDVCEQRDALREQLQQLQDKFALVKQSRETEEQTLLQQQSRAELHALKEKFTALEKEAAAAQEKLQRRVSELEDELEESGSSRDTGAEVKRVMNGVFHSLRGEFELGESYSGQAILGVIVTTIKNVTLQLLSGSERPSATSGKKDEDGESEETADEGTTREEAIHVNGEREVGEAEETEETAASEVDEAESDRENEVQKVEEALLEQKTVETETSREVRTEECTGNVKSTTAERKAAEEEEERETRQEKDICPSVQAAAATAAERREEEKPEQGSTEEVSTEAATDDDATVQTDVERRKHKHVQGTDAPPLFGPPANPPPPPNPLQDGPPEDTNPLQDGPPEDTNPLQDGPPEDTNPLQDGPPEDTNPLQDGPPEDTNPLQDGPPEDTNPLQDGPPEDTNPLQDGPPEDTRESVILESCHYIIQSI